MKLYLASSARNPHYPRVRDELRHAGHEVYDWSKGASAYTWPEVGINDPDGISPQEMIAAGKSEMLNAGMKADMDAIHRCDALVLLLPAGADAHFEFGYAVARGKPHLILAPSARLRASQFYGLCSMTDSIFSSTAKLVKALEEL